MSELVQLERDAIQRESIVGDAEPPPSFNQLVRLLADRYSCRGFRPDSVPRETIARLLAGAQLTPSWCNTQPWQVHVTCGDGTERFRRALYAHVRENPDAQDPDFAFPARYSGIYLARRRETAWRLYDRVGVRKGDREASHAQALENFRLFGAPHVMVVTTERELGVYGAVDCGIFLGNVMALAQSLGLATIPQASLARVAPFVRSYFGLPANRMVLCGLSFGYSDEQHPANSFRTARSPAAQGLTWVDD